MKDNHKKRLQISLKELICSLFLWNIRASLHHHPLHPG